MCAAGRSTLDVSAPRESDEAIRPARLAVHGSSTSTVVGASHERTACQIEHAVAGIRCTERGGGDGLGVNAALAVRDWRMGR